MPGNGFRSGLYSRSKFTNWSPHDPAWSEVSALASRLRPTTQIEHVDGTKIDLFERPLAEGFVRPCSVDNVVRLVADVPAEFLVGLAGIYLLGGTASQLRLRSLTHGMYEGRRIFLCAFPESRLRQQWNRRRPTTSEMKMYTKFGAEFRALRGGGAALTFGGQSLRLFYLYDVLLHEIGHHVDHGRHGPAGERFALWFADYQRAHLSESVANEA